MLVRDRSVPLGVLARGGEQPDQGRETAHGTVLPVLVLAAMIGAALVGGLVQAGRRESEVEKARLAEQARPAVLRSMEKVWAMDSREFEEHIAPLCRRDGCTDGKRVSGVGDLGAD